MIFGSSSTWITRATHKNYCSLCKTGYQGPNEVSTHGFFAMKITEKLVCTVTQSKIKIKTIHHNSRISDMIYHWHINCLVKAVFLSCVIPNLCSFVRKTRNCKGTFRDTMLVRRPYNNRNIYHWRLLLKWKANTLEQSKNCSVSKNCAITPLLTYERALSGRHIFMSRNAQTWKFKRSLYNKPKNPVELKTM